MANKKQWMRAALAGCLTLSSLTLAAGAAEPASVWSGELYAEGQPVVSLRSADDVRLPVILYRGSTYFPLRSAGELTGKNVGWDEATQTASLSGQTARILHTDQPEVSAIPESGNLEIEPAPDIQITVDGKAVALKDANGVPVSPLLYAGSTYVPLRSVGELTGYDVTWARSSGGAEDIYLRTPLTDDQIQAANDYLYAQVDHMTVLHDLSNQLIWGEALTESARTETVSALAAELDEMQAETCPDLPLFAENAKALQSAIAQAAQTVDGLKTAPLAEVADQAKQNFRYDAEQELYIPLLTMKLTLDQTGAVTDSRFLAYDFNQNP